MNFRLTCYFVLTLVLVPLVSFGSDAKISINFKEVQLKNFIEYIGKVTNKNFVLDPNVGTKKISIICPRPMSLEEVYKVFESVLQVYGFTTIPGKYVIKIVPSVQARRHYNPVERGAARREDKFITQVIPLKYAPAEEVRRTIVNMVSREGLVVTYRPTNLLIICDFESNIHKVLKIVNSMDIPKGEVVIKTFSLKYTSCKDIAQVLGKLFSSIMRIENKKGNIASFLAIPYNRLNSVVVVAPENVIAKVEGLIVKLDKPAPEGSGNIHVVKLKNANAVDLAKVLVQLAGTKISGKANVSKQIISRETKVVADKATNSLIITSTPEEFKTISKIIEKLDVPRKQVFIEAMIVEVSGENNFSFGINWQAMGKIGSKGHESFLMGNINGGIGTTFDEVKQTITNVSSLAPFTFGIISFPFTYDANNDGIISSDERFYNAGSLIHAASTKNNVNIISRPQLTVMENEDASVIVAENRPFQTKIETTDTQDYANFEYKDIGITLKVTPQINDSGFVKMKIYQEVSRVDETLTTSSTFSLRPITKKRAAETTVEVKSGDTVVIAGLIEEQDNDNNTKVPLLGDIPILGYLFKNIDRKKSKKNLMIFITPHIVETNNDLKRLSEEKIKYINGMKYDLDGKVAPIKRDFKIYPPVLLKLK
ncbi:type II secretion system secretin GspD [Desulfothermus okinawensis]